MLLVDSLWDQEDIYGATAVYRAIKPKDTQNDMVFLVLGPWHHGQEITEGSSLGALKFPTDTALDFRRAGAGAVSRAVSEGWRAEGGHRAGDGIRNRNEQVAAAVGLAVRDVRAAAP